MIRVLHRAEAIPAVLLVLAIAAGAMLSPYFLDTGYLLGSSRIYVETGMVSLGMTFVIVSGNIDLSVGSSVALTAGVVAKLLSIGMPVGWAWPAGIAFGALLGVFNGIVVSKLRLSSVLVTLATMAIYRGVAEVLLGPASIRLPTDFASFGNATAFGTPVPYSLILLALMAAASAVLLGRTVLGRWIYSVGTNERAAVFSGVPSGRVVTLSFILSGAFAGMGGLLVAARLGVARFDSAKGMELDAITAVVLGGASIFGGSGSILGTALALLVLAVLRIGMGVANVTQEYQLAVIGTLLVVAVAVGAIFQRPGSTD